MSRIILLTLTIGFWSLHAHGSAQISNESDQEVYYSVVVGPQTDEYQLLTGTVDVPFESVGTSIKLASDATVLQPYSPQPPITQFEFTWNQNESTVYWDISNQNGYPFSQSGLTVQPSLPPEGSCLPVVCSPGSSICADAYTTPGEYPSETHSCSYSGLTLSLFIGGGESAKRSTRVTPFSPRRSRMHPRHILRMAS